MKRSMFFGLLLLLTGASAFASYGNTDMRLAVADANIFTVHLDGRKVGRFFTQADLYDMRPGRHYMVVRAVTPCGTNPVLFRGDIHLKPHSQIKARIDHRGRFEIRRVINKPGRNAPVWGGGAGCDEEVPFGVYQGHAAGGYVQVMSSSAFNGLIQTLKHRRFENDRIDIALHAIDHNALTSDQVRRILLTLDFEKSRLDVAVAAYEAVVDPNRYHVVTSAFRFSVTADRMWDRLA